MLYGRPHTKILVINELKVCIITQKDSSAVIRFLLKLRFVCFFYCAQDLLPWISSNFMWKT